MADVLIDFQWSGTRKDTASFGLHPRTSRMRGPRATPKIASCRMGAGGAQELCIGRLLAGATSAGYLRRSKRLSSCLPSSINTVSSSTKSSLLLWPRRASTPSPDRPEMGNSVRWRLKQAEMFRRLLDLKEAGNPRKLASFFQSRIMGRGLTGVAASVHLVPDPERGVRLRVSPHLADQRLVVPTRAETIPGTRIFDSAAFAATGSRLAAARDFAQTPSFAVPSTR